MTFTSNMQAVEQSSVTELYEITTRDKVYRYTTNRTDLTFLGNLYRRASMKRSGFSVDRELGSPKVSISGFYWPPLQEYFAASPLPATTIQIYRAITQELTAYANLFFGSVRRASVANKVITVECVQTTRLSTKLPKIIHQPNCNWQVFDCDCGLSADDYAVGATIIGVSNQYIRSPTFALFPTGYFIQGRVLFEGDFRFITGYDGEYLALQMPFSSLVNGDYVVAYPGCDGLKATCSTKFNNVDHFCGMPMIPSHNPVVWGFT